jgi:glutamate-1-semialdehyde 2,1-aminomutase
MTQWQKSKDLWERSKQSLAGGISSNVRLSAKPHPLFFERAEGAMLYDVDGNAYIDYLMSQGPMILGHSPHNVLDAVNTAMRQGQLYAGQHMLEIEVAEKLIDLIPSAELCRFGLSGSEMVQAAMRLGRAVTGRSKILRFEGHYHGWFDNVLINVGTPLDEAGSRERPKPTIASKGQMTSVLEDFVVLPWNDLALVESLFAEMGDEIAVIMCEPIMCNTGAILPNDGYLEGLRRICDEYGALLYLDETITGFRVGLEGAQGRFGVTPDLSSFAKAMAGGIANSALVGKREYMERFAIDVNHSGTFNSNVLSMAASAATLVELQHDGGAVYRHMDEIGQALIDGIREIAQRLDRPVLVQGIPTAFHVSFTEAEAIKDYRDYATLCDKERYGEFTVALLEQGLRLSARGIWYISAAHTQAQVAQTLEAVEVALRKVWN